KKETVMCPSFQATGNEYDTTRARAQALRAIVNGHFPKEDWVGEELYQVLDLCIECKGCKKECPSQVDMAKMKAEFLFHYHQKHGTSIRRLLIGHMGSLYWLGSYFPALFRSVSKSRLAKTLLEWIGFTSKRPLPELAEERFSHWFKNHHA